MTQRPTMEALVEDYLARRRSLGFALRIDAGQLRSFARFADTASHRGPLTIDLMTRWATTPGHCARRFPGRRLDVLRPFARERAAIDPANEIPPAGHLGPARRRGVRHIYTDAQLRALVAEAHNLGPPGSLRPVTYATLFGLLAACGLRVSEALRLTCADVDLDHAVLTIRMTKFRKSRMVPLHATTADALRAYARHRDRVVRRQPAAPFFVTKAGSPLPYSTVRHAFKRLRSSLGWDRAVPRPRIHDLRHTFACRRLGAWYAAGDDAAVRVAALATYLGHAHVSDTYWYLTGSPELLAFAAQRFELFAAPASKQEAP
ncbi:MAG: tyrosine-type recombinase/integrase [Minicystis sp.]